MENQPDLFERKEPSIGTLNAMVFSIMLDGSWRMPWEICNAVKARTQVLISDSSATARIRDLRKTRYGSHVIEKRKRVGSKAYEYRLTK